MRWTLGELSEDEDVGGVRSLRELPREERPVDVSDGVWSALVAALEDDEG